LLPPADTVLSPDGTTLALSGCWVSRWSSVSAPRNGLCGRLGSGGRGPADDLVPGGESGVHLVSVLDCGVAPGSEVGDILLNADKNRCAPPGEVNFFIARSRCLVGW
jgi:hypothetical protein